MAAVELNVEDRRASTSSQRITDACVGYATRVRFQRVTMADLCAVTGVSERRVRDAFYEVYGASPTSQLRHLALHEVRRALVEVQPVRDAVTRAAMDFGFGHLSRFAAHYRAAFGESPSSTLRHAMR
jgi:AraC family ethanolamine operon transcriptional activator